MKPLDADIQPELKSNDNILNSENLVSGNLEKNLRELSDFLSATSSVNQQVYQSPQNKNSAKSPANPDDKENLYFCSSDQKQKPKKKLQQPSQSYSKLKSERQSSLSSKYMTSNAASANNQSQKSDANLNRPALTKSNIPSINMAQVFQNQGKSLLR